MAGPLVVLGANAGRTAASAYLKDLLIKIGAWEAVSQAAEHVPDLIGNMVDSMRDSGVDPKDLLSSKDGKKVVLTELARQGVTLDSSAGLSKGELTKYLSALKEFGSKLTTTVDSKQAVRPTTEDPRIARAAYLQGMQRVCAWIGLTGPNRFRQLYEIATVVNTITEKDIEDAELHEQLYGKLVLR